MIAAPPMSVVVNGKTVVVQPGTDGLSLSGDVPARVIPWQTILDTPAAWGLVVDGWLHPSRLTEAAAFDRASDLRSSGASVQIVRLAAN